MIEIQGLYKSFKRLSVLEGIDLSFRSGETAIIAGPNASGKSTLIKTILGLHRPDAGTILVRGARVQGAWEYRKEIGYMPQDPRFPENLTAREVVSMLKHLRRCSSEPERELSAFFELDGFLDKPIRTLSGGTRQKVNALVALLFSPEILILDEPTAGLDPLTSERFRDRIRGERERGRLILLTTHHYTEMDELADRLIFLMEGKVRFDGAPADLRRRAREIRLDRAVARLMEGRAA